MFTVDGMNQPAENKMKDAFHTVLATSVITI